MGGTRREIMGFLFIIILFCFSMATTPSSLQQISTTESSYHQQTNKEKHGKDDGVTNQIDKRYSASAVAVSNRFSRGNSGSGGGGDGGGGSRPHTGGGGTAIIPIYAAGSAQARRHQGRRRNAGTRHENNMGLFVAAVLAVITHMYRVF